MIGGAIGYLTTKLGGGYNGKGPNCQITIWIYLNLPPVFLSPQLQIIWYNTARCFVQKLYVLLGGIRKNGSQYDMRPPPPVTDHVPLYSESLCKNMTRASWGVQIICAH